MKKLFLFLTMAALFTGCSNDDDNTTPTLSSGYLRGYWIETDPTNYTFSFDETTATLTDVNEPYVQEYIYSIEEGKLIVTIPGDEYSSSFDIEIVDRNTFKLTSLYPSLACVECPKTVSTFERAQFEPVD